VYKVTARCLWGKPVVRGEGLLVVTACGDSSSREWLFAYGWACLCLICCRSNYLKPIVLRKVIALVAVMTDHSVVRGGGLLL
jgi:hypothetical protein